MVNTEKCLISNDDRYRNLDRVNYWIVNCDTKASFLLTLAGVILTILLTSSQASSLISGSVTAFNTSWLCKEAKYEAKPLIEFVILFLFAVSYTLTIWNLLQVFVARLNPEEYTKATPEKKESFFARIKSFFVKAIRFTKSFFLKLKSFFMTKKEQDKEKKKDKGSLIFFLTVSTRDLAEFKEEWNSPEYNLSDDIETQFYINSKICTKKFKHYNNAIKYIRFTLTFFSIYFIYKTIF